MTTCEQKGNSKLDWLQYDQKCYYFSSTESTWQSAESLCKQEGGFLVSIQWIETMNSIHSRNENNLIASRVIFLKLVIIVSNLKTTFKTSWEII